MNLTFKDPVATCQLGINSLFGPRTLRETGEQYKTLAECENNLKGDDCIPSPVGFRCRTRIR